jgi:hypothetical protein
MIFAAITLVTLVAVAVANMARPPKNQTDESPKKKQPGSAKKKRTDLLQIKVTSTKQSRKVAYAFKILKLKADIEVIWCEKGPGDDAFIHPLIKQIEENNMLGEQGVIAVVRRRMSRTDNSVRFNQNDAYPRRLIVRTVDESTHQSRMAMLMLCRDFMMRPENNRFTYEYQVDNSSDLTPLKEDMLEPVNAYIPDSSIVNIIMAVYEIDNDTWFTRNRDIATDYFGDVPYPRYAVEMLGYPDNDDDHLGQYARGFNPPIPRDN